MKRGRKPKSEFEDIPEEFRNAVEQGTEVEIKQKVAQVALANQELLNAKENDADLKSKVEEAKEAGAIYREGIKANKLKIKFAKAVLTSRGKT